MFKAISIVIYFVSFFYFYSKRNERHDNGLNSFQIIFGSIAFFGLGIFLYFGFDFFIDFFPDSWGYFDEDGSWMTTNQAVGVSLAGYFGLWITYKVLRPDTKNED